MGSSSRRTPGGGRSLAGRYGKVGVGECSPGLRRSAGFGFVSLCARARKGLLSGRRVEEPGEWGGMDGAFGIGSLSLSLLTSPLVLLSTPLLSLRLPLLLSSLSALFPFFLSFLKERVPLFFFSNSFKRSVFSPKCQIASPESLKRQKR